MVLNWSNLFLRYFEITSHIWFTIVSQYLVNLKKFWIGRKPSKKIKKLSYCRKPNNIFGMQHIPLNDKIRKQKNINANTLVLIATWITYWVFIASLSILLHKILPKISIQNSNFSPVLYQTIKYYVWNYQLRAMYVIFSRSFTFQTRNCNLQVLHTGTLVFYRRQLKGMQIIKCTYY